MVRPTSAGPFAPLHSNAESAVDRMHCTGYEARLRPRQPGDHARDFLKPSVALDRYEVMHQIFHRTVFGVGFGVDRPKLNDVDRDATQPKITCKPPRLGSNTPAACSQFRPNGVNDITTPLWISTL
jgi:hypothetical protein